MIFIFDILVDKVLLKKVTVKIYLKILAFIQEKQMFTRHLLFFDIVWLQAYHFCLEVHEIWGNRLLPVIMSSKRDTALILRYDKQHVS